jgi:hypothetical protein
MADYNVVGSWGNAGTDGTDPISCPDLEVWSGRIGVSPVCPRFISPGLFPKPGLSGPPACRKPRRTAHP